MAYVPKPNERVAVCGWSGTGKTTLSRAWGRVCHTDNYVNDGTEHAARMVCELLNAEHYDCYEGVLVPLALRRWLDRNPLSIPVHRLIVCRLAHRAQTPTQRAQGRWHDRILVNITPNLTRRGVIIEVLGE